MENAFNLYFNMCSCNITCLFQYVFILGNGDSLMNEKSNIYNYVKDTSGQYFFTTFRGI